MATGFLLCKVAIYGERPRTDPDMPAPLRRLILRCWSQVCTCLVLCLSVNIGALALPILARCSDLTIVGHLRLRGWESGSAWGYEMSGSAASPDLNSESVSCAGSSASAFLRGNLAADRTASACGSQQVVRGHGRRWCRRKQPQQTIRTPALAGAAVSAASPEASVLHIAHLCWSSGDPKAFTVEHSIAHKPRHMLRCRVLAPVVVDVPQWNLLASRTLVASVRAGMGEPVCPL